MRLLERKLENLRKLEDDLQKTVIATLEENEVVICEMVAQIQQFERGITGDGVKIEDYAPYSPVTIQIKQSKGQPTDRVTLEDSGRFHEGFYIEFRQDDFVIKSSDSKYPKLISLYGDAIMNLTEEHKIEISREYLFPELIKTVKKV